MEGTKLENKLLELEPIENVLMESLKSLHMEREFNYTLDLLHSQFVHTVHDLEQLHKDKIAWYLLHLPNVLKVELVNTMIKRDIHNKQIEHDSEVAHEKRVEAAKYDWSKKHHHKTNGHNTSHSTMSTDSNVTSDSYVSDTDWVTSYSQGDKCFFYYNRITGESTWECPDLSKHYKFVDWKIPQVQETVEEHNYESPHSPVPANKLHEKQHHHHHNHHLHAHRQLTKASVCNDTPRVPPADVDHKDHFYDVSASDAGSVETRQSTLVDENYHPKKEVKHPPLTLLARIRDFGRHTLRKWNE